VNTIIQVDNEQMQVTGVSGNSLTVTRGVDGTTIATHANGSQVVIPIDVPGHTISLNGTGVNTINNQGQVTAENGALQNTAGDNIWDGPVVILPQTQPSETGNFPSFSAASGTALTLPSSITGQYMVVGGGGSGYNGNNGGGTIILPSGTNFT
jgi:hypothetical protein